MTAAESMECSAESAERLNQPRETAIGAPGGPNAVLDRQPTDSMIRGSALPSGSGVCFPDCTASAPRTRTGLQSLLVSAVGAVVLLVHRMKSDSGGILLPPGSGYSRQARPFLKLELK